MSATGVFLFEDSLCSILSAYREGRERERGREGRERGEEGHEGNGEGGRMVRGEGG